MAETGVPRVAATLALVLGVCPTALSASATRPIQGAFTTARGAEKVGSTMKRVVFATSLQRASCAANAGYIRGLYTC